MSGHFVSGIDAFSALTFGMIAYPLMLAHIIALGWFLFRRAIAPLLALNLLVSGGVLVSWALRFDAVVHDTETVWAVVAFEIAAFAVSVAAIFGARVPRAVVVAAFAAQMALIAAAIFFIVTFKVTRLI